MKNRLEFDTFMISLGLGTVVLQWGFDRQEKIGAERLAAERMEAASMAQVAPPVQEPLYKLTIPEGSPYQNLAWPHSSQPNPFEQVESIVRQNEGIANYAGKDTDMRILLEAHQGQPYYFILQQQAANEMLRHELFHHYYQDPTSADMLAGIEFYTQQLVEAGSADSKLIYMCLRALRDVWPREKIAEVARQTAERVLAPPALAGADTATTIGYHQVVYARVLQKMGAKAGP